MNLRKIMFDKTETAFADYIGRGGKMEMFNKAVHVETFNMLAVKGKCKQILKKLNKIADKEDKLLVQSLIAKLRYGMPYLDLSAHFKHVDQFGRENARLISAGVVVNSMLDSGQLPIKEETERTVDDETGKVVYHTRHYVVLGGSFVKDLWKGFHLESGKVITNHVDGWSLTPDEREVLAMISSVPLIFDQSVDYDTLMKGFSLQKDWGKKVDSKGNDMQEDPLSKKRRKQLYASKIIENAKKWTFYLSAFFDHRRRQYYDAGRAEGMLPQGKLWQVLNIDSAKPFLLDHEDAMVLRHIMYVELHGRIAMDKANKLFTAKDWCKCFEMDPMEAKDEKEFGKARLLNKAAKAYHDYLTGTESHSMFGQDFTNSGLMMAAVGFRSKKMMKASNLAGHVGVNDSHTVFQAAFKLDDLTRDDAKQLHMALLHGGREETLQKQLEAALGTTVSMPYIREALELAYGPSVRNITAIADWCSLALGNKHNMLRWTMPDGWTACSKSYMENVPMELYIISARHEKQLYCHYTISTNMPLKEDNNGRPIYGRNTVTLAGVEHPVVVHKRGLYADLTHSCDAFVLRAVVRALHAAGEPFVLKHDDFITRPGAKFIVKSAAKEALGVLYRAGMYQKALEEIKAHSPYNPPLPRLIMGDAPNQLSKADNFLMP